MEKGAATIREKEWIEEERERHRRTNRELKLARHVKPGYHGRRWTKKEKSLVGTMPDAEVARRIGRTLEAVRHVREYLGILNRFLQFGNQSDRETS